MAIRYDIAQGVGGDYVNVTKGPLQQPNYTRGDTTQAKSEKLLGYRNCVQGKISGATPGNRKQARTNFCVAAAECSEGGKMDKSACEKKYGVSATI